MKILIFLVFAVLSSVVIGAGQKSPLTDDDLKKAHIQDLAEQGKNKIQDQKKSRNALPSCVELDGELKSGTKQVVAGFNYNFEIKVTPKKSSNPDCASENVDLSSVPTENCSVNIWEKPGGKEVVITPGTCNRV